MCLISHSQKYISIQHTHIYVRRDRECKRLKSYQSCSKVSKMISEMNTRYRKANSFRNRKISKKSTHTKRAREKEKKTSCTRTAFIDLVHYTIFFRCLLFSFFSVAYLFFSNKQNVYVYCTYTHIPVANFLLLLSSSLTVSDVFCIRILCFMNIINVRIKTHIHENLKISP